MASQNPQAAVPPQADDTAPAAVKPARSVEQLRRDLKWTVPRARTAIFWEQSWPRILPSVSLTGIFLSSAWSGAWAYLPPEGRMIGVGLFAVAMLACLTPLRKLRIPSKAEGIARIEANTGLPHNPVETILGEPTVKDKNSESYRLWQDHQEQTAARVGKFKAGAPHPGMAQKDPRGLRFLPAFIMAVAMAAGGIDGASNMSQPFDWTRPPPAVIPARVDAWVTPPEYTRAAPVFLTVNSEVRAETPNGSELVAPTGSRMVIRVAGGDSTVTVTGGVVIEKEPPPLPPETDVTQQGQTTPDGRPARPILREYELLITDDATVSIQAYGGVNLSWSFDIAPDSAPQVSVQAAPNAERPNLIDLQYGAQDDHGVVNIETVIGTGEPPKSKSERPPRPLIEAPVINLPVPR